MAMNADATAMMLARTTVLRATSVCIRRKLTTLHGPLFPDRVYTHAKFSTAWREHS
jgi:hypothetical protein